MSLSLFPPRRPRLVSLLALLAVAAGPGAADECHLTPVIHVLQFPGCTPKPIPSFACAGRCTSYVQVGAWAADSSTRSDSEDCKV